MASLLTMEKETPLAGTGGASCDSFAGLSPELSSLGYQGAQFLMLAHAIRPELAVMAAALVFGGQGNA